MSCENQPMMDFQNEEEDNELSTALSSPSNGSMVDFTENNWGVPELQKSEV